MASRHNSTDALTAAAKELKFKGHSSVEMDGQDMSDVHMDESMHPLAANKNKSTRELMHTATMSDCDIHSPANINAPLRSYQTVRETFRGNWHIFVMLILLCIVAVLAIAAAALFFYAGYLKSGAIALAISVLCAGPAVYYIIYIDRARFGVRGYRLEKIPAWRH